MVVAWIAIDELTNITMDMYEGTHIEYSKVGFLQHNSRNIVFVPKLVEFDIKSSIKPVF